MHDGPATAVEDTAKVLRRNEPCPRQHPQVKSSSLPFDVAIGTPLNAWLDGRGNEGSEDTSWNRLFARRLQSVACWYRVSLALVHGIPTGTVQYNPSGARRSYLARDPFLQPQGEEPHLDVRPQRLTGLE